jgi:hypothetical protein
VCYEACVRELAGELEELPERGAVAENKYRVRYDLGVSEPHQALLLKFRLNSSKTFHLNYVQLFRATAMVEASLLGCVGENQSGHYFVSYLQLFPAFTAVGSKSVMAVSGESSLGEFEDRGPRHS